MDGGGPALGVNRFRALWTISVRAARPAIVAAAVLATARALGEAIMLSMVTGSVGFAPNPLDGRLFFLEPARPLAATIVDNAEGLSVEPFGQTIYAFAAVLLRLERLPVVRRLVHPPHDPPPGDDARRDPGRRVPLAPAFRSLQRGRGSHEHLRRNRCPAPGRAGAGVRRRRARPATPGASGTGSASRLPGSPGIGLCVIAASILIYMLVRGLQFLKLDMLVTHPAAGAGAEGHRRVPRPDHRHLRAHDPGDVIATPIGVAIAVWLSEYGRPPWLARAVESGVEIVAGTPTIVLAIFGLLVFSQGIFSLPLLHGRGRRGVRPLVLHRRAR